jgi:argininosuccinate lyase
MERLNASVHFDKRLFRQDIEASKAHAAMLGAQGILSEDDAGAIRAGLDMVLAEMERGDFPWREDWEDIHTHVENRLRELIGEAAGRLHTARSRNDQVALDLRLWVAGSIGELDLALADWQRALVEVAEKYGSAIMPGYTHLQRAQPVLLAHHLLAYVEMAWRDRQRLEDCARRVKVMPLGAAALAGTTYPVNPGLVARDLGWEEIAANSMDAVSDRDFAAEFIFACALIQTHLSRLAEELVLWSSSEFDFIRLADSFSTGSSIMPQKRNPDAAELIRGKTGRVNGDLLALLTVLKGLPLTYNKDLQEDKEPLFDAFDTVMDCLKVMAPMLRSLGIKTANMRRAVEKGFLNATELADYLAARGLPFREAHETAARAVTLAEKDGRALEDLHMEELRALHQLIGPDIYEALAHEQAVARRASPGGTSSVLVARALARAKEKLWPPA